MRSFSFYSIVIFILAFAGATHAQTVVIKGRVTGIDHKGIGTVSVKLGNTTSQALTDISGNYILFVPVKKFYKITFSHLSFVEKTKNLDTDHTDTIELNIQLEYKTRMLDPVAVYAVNKPETLIGKPYYSIYDFDFYEDKLLLLTATRSLKNAQVQLAGYDGTVLFSRQIPANAGDALRFFPDYEGQTELICKDSILRVTIKDYGIILNPLLKSDFDKYIQPVCDTMRGNYYINDAWEKYPSMNYYFLSNQDSTAHQLKNIVNPDLMALYNLEYYYLPSRMQLEARRIADTYKTDKSIVAALMSGFTQSMYYEPLYAPLFILNDTICIFNHHNDYLYHYNETNQLIDSVRINYHHPANWREWKKKLIVDEVANKVYAFYSKNGHHYLK